VVGIGDAGGGQQEHHMGLLELAPLARPPAV